MWQMSQWSMEMDWRPFAISGLVQGLGMGLVFIPLNTLAFASLPASMRTDGASLLNLFRSVGASVGISIASALLGQNIQTSHSDLASHITGSTINNIDASTADRFQGLGDQALMFADAMVNKQAAMIAYLDDYWAMMWVTLAVIPLVFLLQKPKPGATAGPLME